MTFPIITDLRTIKKPKRPVTRVFLHCSASDHPHHDNAATIHEWHIDPKRPGGPFSQIGYHFFIRKDGTIESGRSIERTPAAQKGHNTGTIAICLHGLDKNKFTHMQRASLRALCLHLNGLYKGGLTFHGHKEVEPNKACPVFDYREWLDLDERGRIVI